MKKSILRQLTYTDKTLLQIRKENKVFDDVYKVFFLHKDDYKDFPISNGVAIFNEAIYQCICACIYADPQEHLTQKLDCFAIQVSFTDYYKRVMVFCIVYYILSLRKDNPEDVEMYLSALERYLKDKFWFNAFKEEVEKQLAFGKHEIELKANPMHPYNLHIEPNVWKLYTHNFEEREVDRIIHKYKDRPLEEKVAIIDILENAYNELSDLPF